MHSVDCPVLRIEDPFERFPCGMEYVRPVIVIKGENDGSIPRALFCLNSIIDFFGSAATSTSQSVANADALDAT